MVIVADWFEIPYRFKIPTSIFELNGQPLEDNFTADVIYADRNSYWSDNDIGDNDKVFIPDMGVSRMLGYDFTSVSILLNIGYLYENNLLNKSNKALFVSDFAIDEDHEDLVIVAETLTRLYSGNNLYYEGDPTSEVDINNPSRDEMLTLAKEREYIQFSAHGGPNYIGATSPGLNGEAILEKRTYKPALWFLDACNTVEYCDFCGNTNLDGILRSSAVNVFGSIDTLFVESSQNQWYMPYFKQKYRISDVVRLGLQDARNELGDMDEIGMYNVNCVSQYQLIGDPFIIYGNN